MDLSYSCTVLVVAFDALEGLIMMLLLKALHGIGVGIGIGWSVIYGGVGVLRCHPIFIGHN
ncbi:hypothetical protein [Vibrio cortegadensis]